MANILDLIFHADTTQLEHAKTKLHETKHEANLAADATEHLENVFGGFGGAVSEAVEHISRFNNTIGKMLESMNHVVVKNSEGSTAVAKFGAALGATGAIVGTLAIAMGVLGVAMAFEWYEKIEQAGDLAAKFGISTSAALLMAEAATKAGTSLDAVFATYDKVAKAAYNANDPLKGTGAAFKTLGVSATEANGNLKDSKELTEQLTKAYEEGNKTSADKAAMMAILGKGWRAEVAAQELVAEAEKIAQEQQKLGIGINKEANVIVEEHTKSQIRMSGVMSDFGSKLMSAVIPSITSMTNSFTKSYEEGGFVKQMMEGLILATKALMSLFLVVEEFVYGLVFAFNTLGKSIGAVVAAMVLAGHGDFKGAWAVLTDIPKSAGEEWDKLNHKVGGLRNDMVSIWDDKRTFDKSDDEKPKGPGKKGKADPAKKGITEDLLPAIDIYASFEKSLEKMLETQDHFNESQKAETEIKRLNLEYAKKEQEIEDHNAKVRKDGVGVLKQQMDSSLKEHEIALIREKAKAVDSATTANTLQEEGILKLSKVTDAYNKTIREGIDNTYKTKDAIQLETEIIKVQSTVEEARVKLRKEGNLGAKEEIELTKMEKDSIDALTKSHDKLIESQKDWLGNGIKAYIVGLGTLQQGYEKLATMGIQGVSDSLYNLFTTGKSGFKDLVASMLEQIAKLIFQLYVLKPLLESIQGSMGGGGGFGDILGSLFSGFSSGAGGGLASMSTDMGMPGMFADGGVVNRATSFGMAGGGSGIMGEAGPEAIMPLSRGSNGKLGVQISGGSGGSGNGGIVNNNTYQINVTGATDPSAVAKQVAEQVRLAQMIADQRIAVQLKSGGMLNRTAVNAF